MCRFAPLMVLFVCATALTLGCSGQLLDRERNSLLLDTDREVAPSWWLADIFSSISTDGGDHDRKFENHVRVRRQEPDPADDEGTEDTPEDSATEDPASSTTESTNTTAATNATESTTTAAPTTTSTTTTTTAAPTTASTTTTTTSTTTTAAPSTTTAASTTEETVDLDFDTATDDEEVAATPSTTSTTSTTTTSATTTTQRMVFTPTPPLHDHTFTVRCNLTFCTVSVDQGDNFYTLMNNSQARAILGNQIRRAIVDGDSPNCEPVNKWPAPIVSTSQIDYVSESPNVRGAYAAEQQFPWHALIKFDNYQDSTCGGALITSSLVLVPASCFWRKRLGQDPMRYSKLNVRLGATTSNAPGALVFSLNQWDELYHPRFNPKDAYLRNNIGAIKLPNRVFLTSAINIIELGIQPTPGAVLQVIGYGRDSMHHTLTHLRYHGVQLTAPSACVRAYGTVACQDDVLTAVGTHLNNNATLCQVEPGAALIEYKPPAWFGSPNVRLYGLATFVGRTGMCNIEHSEPEGFVRLLPHIEWIRRAVRAAENIINGVASEENYQH